jgi:hypothetical protein
VLTAREKRAYYYGNVPAADDASAPYSPTKKGIFATPPPRRDSGGGGGIGGEGYGLNNLNIFTPSHKH